MALTGILCSFDLLLLPHPRLLWSPSRPSPSNDRRHAPIAVLLSKEGLLSQDGERREGEQEEQERC